MNDSIQLDNDLASRIVNYMQIKSYHIATEEKDFNIVYVEGIDADGTLNDNALNHFNARRLVIEFIDGIPKIVGNWEATTRPGLPWILNPTNPKGTAIIKFGQYEAWRVGLHGSSGGSERLIQVNPVGIHRDINKDGSRIDETVEAGIFGIDQDCSYDCPKNNVGRATNGALLGRTRVGHHEFISLIKQDTRYKVNSGHTFVTTIISGEDLVKK